MRIIKILFFVISLTTVGLSQAWAGDITGFGSYWNTDDADDTWGVGGKVGLGVTEMLEIEGRGTWYDDVTDDGGPGDIDIEAIPIEAGVALNFLPEQPLNPYIMGGAGYHFLDTNRGSIDDEFGWYAGGGVEIGGPENVAFVVEALYRGIEGEVDDDDEDVVVVRDDIDIDLSGLAVNAGIQYRW